MEFRRGHFDAKRGAGPVLRGNADGHVLTVGGEQKVEPFNDLVTGHIDSVLRGIACGHPFEFRNLLVIHQSPFPAGRFVTA